MACKQPGNRRDEHINVRRTLDEQEFWSIIDAVRLPDEEETEERIDLLREQLQALDLAKLEGFLRVYETLLRRANRWDLRGAAYIVDQGWSDESFWYFCDWLISEGRERFYRVLADPDSLAEVLPFDEFWLQGFTDVACEVYEELSGQEPDVDLAPEPAQAEGTRWQPRDLPALLPRLSAHYLP